MSEDEVGMNRGSEPVEKAKKALELDVFFREAEIGSVKYQALMDYKEIHDINAQMGRLYKALAETESTDKRIWMESELRVNEMRLALMEVERHKNEKQTPGYATAYYFLDSHLDDLRDQGEDVLDDIWSNLLNKTPNS
jgi:hypothetical protein